MLIERSTSIVGSRSLSIADIGERADEMARDGMRVLAFAVRRWDKLPENLIPETVETDLVLLGLVGLIDPPRSEAAEAVRTCLAAGIRPVMITGDHPLTAMAIARRIGILGMTRTDIRSCADGCGPCGNAGSGLQQEGSRYQGICTGCARAEAAYRQGAAGGRTVCCHDRRRRE